MTERNTPGQNTLIVVAIIGACGAIFAACIGLVPTILPVVRPTFTPSAPVVVFTETSFPTDTPIPETPTTTATLTDLPTLTATLEPLPTDTPVTETATITVTPIAAASDMDTYEGLWTNVESEPSSDKVRLIVTRIEISLTSETTANFTVCRATQGGERYVLPNPAQASIYLLGLGARDFMIPAFADLRWAIIVQRTANQLVATVQEYDLNNILLNTETFNLERASPLDPARLIPCGEPALTQ